MDPNGLAATVVVRLPHTDAAGVLFYPRIFDIEEELFERWLEAGGMSVRAMLDRTLAPTPIVRCEADYRVPVRVGDRLEARLADVDVGKTSYELTWTFDLGARRAMEVRVRRVAIDPAGGVAVDLPAALARWLAESAASVRARS